MRCRVNQRVTVCCSVRQSVLQCVAAWCCVLQTEFAAPATKEGGQVRDEVDQRRIRVCWRHGVEVIMWCEAVVEQRGFTRLPVEKNNENNTPA